MRIRLLCKFVGRARSPSAPLAPTASDGSASRPYLLIGVIVSFSWYAFAATLTTSTLDGGGGRQTSASYSNVGSVGGIGGISSNSVPARTAKNGYIGQLYEVASLTVTGMPAAVNETSTSQLSGIATFDDATFAVVPGPEVVWNPPAFPIASINVSGLATPSAVYTNTAGPFSGRYLGILGAGSLLVLDNNPDNYQAYDGDGLPDWWQVGFFGLPPNLDAAPTADPDGDGQDNKFEYVAGLVPTNSASVFLFRIENVVSQPNRRNLIFSPRFVDRMYTPLFRTNLLSGMYQPLTNVSTNDVGLERTYTDLNAVEPNKIYQIQITLP